MGYQHYICFIMRNGQNLTRVDLESDDENFSSDDDSECGLSNRDAKIVLVPDDVDIYSLKYPDFGKYQAIDATLDKKGWNFTDISDYQDRWFKQDEKDVYQPEGNLIVNSNPNRYLDKRYLNDFSIFKSFKYPNKTLVIFEPTVYSIFVSGEISYEKLDKGSHILLQRQRGTFHSVYHDVPDKKESYQLIVDNPISPWRIKEQKELETNR